MQDKLAYGNERGLYQIIDNETGKVYFGISGIGVVELGTKVEGKVTKEIER